MYTKKNKVLNATNKKEKSKKKPLNFFSYYLSLVWLCNPSFPAAMPSEIASMITGRPTHSSSVFADVAKKQSNVGIRRHYN